MEIREMEIREKLNHFTFIGPPTLLIPIPSNEDYLLTIIKHKAQQSTNKLIMEENKTREINKRGKREGRERQT